MKRNVDLTENRFFSSNNPFNDISIGVLTAGIVTGEKFPWNAYIEIIDPDNDLYTNQQKTIIIVGNKKTRAKIKEYRQMDSLDYCDCCGKRMNLKPWDLEIGVCHQCNDHYTKQEDKCKWRKKEKISNAVIRTA